MYFKLPIIDCALKAISYILSLVFIVVIGVSVNLYILLAFNRIIKFIISSSISTYDSCLLRSTIDSSTIEFLDSIYSYILFFNPGCSKD